MSEGKHWYAMECRHCGQRFMDMAKLLVHPCRATSPLGSEKNIEPIVREPPCMAYGSRQSLEGPGVPQCQCHGGADASQCAGIPRRYRAAREGGRW